MNLFLTVCFISGVSISLFALARQQHKHLQQLQECNKQLDTLTQCLKDITIIMDTIENEKDESVELWLNQILEIRIHDALRVPDNMVEVTLNHLLETSRANIQRLQASLAEKEGA